ncbi:MAG: hypothetical protein DWP98_05715 [Bacteroidetes bacterium]|nr:MAG: hypothetical protein DWP98_05715 [Bacteroidota bacterium]MBL1143406.1 hypothetical protein [Bacteroidota bacterium]NOG56210.1 hypothetical protein [Bacteroidota bacterium]
MKNLKNLLYIIPLGLAVSCAPEFEDEITFTNGQADFTTYVAVGNSLTAGFQSSALRKVRQENSFPAILAAQFAEVGGGAFKQPLLADGVGIGSSLNAELKLAYTTDCKGKTSIGPVPSAAAGQADQFSPTTYIGANGPYNNVGVPGAKTYHLVASGYGNPANIAAGLANPFYARFANPANYDESVAAAVARTKPTFFTMWIGANDVLGYGLQGGEEGSDVITATATFNATYNMTLDSLLKSGAKGVLANIPNITSVPYFNVISRNGLELDANQAAQLNAAYAPYNSGIDAAVAGSLITPEQGNRRKISFTAGANRWVITDDKLNSIPGLPKSRQMRHNEHLIMVTPQDSLKCAGWGSSKGIPSNYVLTSDEVTKINTATNEFNNVIKTAASKHNLGFLDANKLMAEMESGLTYNGVTYSADFVTGGAFSLDGFHPSTRGYAIIANEFIDVINDKYGAKVRKIDPNSYEGILFPN